MGKRLGIADNLLCNVPRYPSQNFALERVQGIRSGVEVASHILARADPFQPCQKPLARSLSTENLNDWNGSARAHIYDATSTPGRMPCSPRDKRGRTGCCRRALG
ncbi:hypothetical protein Y032_0012g1821 [Ancylostoma ceylanicum]|nr:hypothetical protein Y032_0012g1821 [Ancylostoma ceylanicum]